jgi:protein-tyrosine phosphatase
MSESLVSEIIEGCLYLGDDWSITHNAKYIKKIGIDCAINVAAEVDYEHRIRGMYNILSEVIGQAHNNIEFRRFPMHDTLEFNIRKVCDDIADYINVLLICKQKVYVHCALGISRSPAVIIYYLMKYHQMTYQVAFDHVKKARSFIRIV